MKKPILVIGILFFLIFLMDLNNKGISIFSREKFQATSCKAIKVPLDKRIPSNWKIKCEANNMAVFINSDQDFNKDIKRGLYRELANHIIYIAKNSPIETLERVDFVRFKLQHAKLTINALTEGKHLANFATLTDPELIQSHFQQTVSVQEKNSN